MANINYDLVPEAHPEDELAKCEWIEVMAELEMHRVHLAINETKRRKREELENRIDFVEQPQYIF